MLLLADVFETFRSTSMQHYGLDPVHLSAPQMSWDALLKKTKVQLELLTDINMHLFMEKGLRGGVCRFAKANYPQCPDYDSTKPNSWVMYLDSNNLYGWAMMQLLPVGGFQWVNAELDEVLTTPDDAAEGYIVEVDLEYPEHLHDSHNDYPLAPETVAAGRITLSKLSWLMPHVTPSIEQMNMLNKHIENKIKIPVAFRAMQCDTLAVPQATSFSWGWVLNLAPKCRVGYSSRSKPTVRRVKLLILLCSTTYR